MSENYFCKNRLIIASPGMEDPLFRRSVAYIFEHNDKGAMGIVINKPLQLTVAGILEHFKVPIDNPEISSYPVLRGGPVAREHGFILHMEKEVGQGAIADPINNIVISASRDDLLTLPQSNCDRIILSLGYARWEQGQLENEILENDWIIAPINLNVMFDVEFQNRWEAALMSIGVDPINLVDTVGHA